MAGSSSGTCSVASNDRNQASITSRSSNGTGLPMPRRRSSRTANALAIGTRTAVICAMSVVNGDDAGTPAIDATPASSPEASTTLTVR